MPSRESLRVAKPASIVPSPPAWRRTGSARHRRSHPPQRWPTRSRLTRFGVRWWHGPSFLLRPHVRPLDKPLELESVPRLFQVRRALLPLHSGDLSEQGGAAGRLLRGLRRRVQVQRDHLRLHAGAAAPVHRGALPVPADALRATGEVLQHGRRSPSSSTRGRTRRRATSSPARSRTSTSPETSTRPRRGARIRQMRPDWVTIVMGSELDGEDAALRPGRGGRRLRLQPGGQRASTRGLPPRTRYATSRRSPTPSALPGHVLAHPDHPRGSWPTARPRSTSSLFENGATPNMVVSTAAPMSPDAFNGGSRTCRTPPRAR